MVKSVYIGSLVAIGLFFLLLLRTYPFFLRSFITFSERWLSSFFISSSHWFMGASMACFDILFFGGDGVFCSNFA